MSFRMMVDSVRAFHDQIANRTVQPMGTTTLELLVKFGTKCVQMAKELENKGLIDDPDHRYLRAHLDLEELGEFLIAMGNGDEAEALDGWADRLYVLIGEAVTMDWPMEAAFNEVHLSNMTKARQPDDPSATRVRSKGPDYRAPDVAAVLAAHRAGPRPRGRNMYVDMAGRLHAAWNRQARRDAKAAGEDASALVARQVAPLQVQTIVEETTRSTRELIAQFIDVCVTSPESEASAHAGMKKLIEDCKKMKEAKDVADEAADK